MPWPVLRKVQMQSLRSRLLVRVTGALMVVFAVAAGALYLLIRASLLSEFDAVLSSRAAAVASLTEQNNQRIKIELDLAQMPEFAVGRRANVFQIWTGEAPANHTLFKSPSLADADLPLPAGAGDHPRFEFIRLPNGKSGRQIAYRFKPRFEGDDGKAQGKSQRSAILVLARPTHDLDDALEYLTWLLLGVSTAAILASVGVMGLVIGRGLRPLQTLAKSIERVGAGDLSERIRLDGTPREMTPVVQRLNDLLARLDSALTREKSFTADVAHELRTPLAGLGTMLEVCATRRREPEAYETVVGKSLRLVQGMHAMVDNLLLLARADARQLSADPEPVDLAPFLRECWSPFEPRATARQLRVEWEMDLNGQVKLDVAKARIILNNLFDNAVTYTDDGGLIRIAAACVGGRTTLTLTNTGSRVAPADAGRLFDRFWRGDEARSDAGIHCGLGLSLCKKIVDLLGGTLTADSRDGTFTVTVTLPTPAHV